MKKDLAMSMVQNKLIYLKARMYTHIYIYV